jgi:hypothetical protein
MKYTFDQNDRRWIVVSSLSEKSVEAYIGCLASKNQNVNVLRDPAATPQDRLSATLGKSAALFMLMGGFGLVEDRLKFDS